MLIGSQTGWVTNLREGFSLISELLGYVEARGMEASNYSLEELLILFDKENKKVIDLARRLSGIRAEIAQLERQLSVGSERSRF